MTLVAANQQTVTTPKDSDVVLSAQGVSKKFCRDFKSALFYGMQDISSEVLGLRGDKNDRLRKKEFWALQDVSFELRRGEALGLVGKNGSGKSTLLRIIAGLIKPDVGSVTVRGRVAPLIALGAGFNPVLTGRENIYANMSILGLTKAEIDDRFDDVVAFAEIPEAINSPVRSYSSGMQARLGFACAIFTEPEILLIDEVLAVGDIKFRGKCFRRLNRLRQNGTSFILVSHNTQHIFNVCKTSLYIQKGKPIAIGETHDVISVYEQELFADKVIIDTPQVHLPDKPAKESKGLDINYVFFRDESGNIIDNPKTGEPVTFCIGIKCHEEIKNANLNIAIKEIAGESEFALVLSSLNDNSVLDIKSGKHEVQLKLPYLGLGPGAYIAFIVLRKDAIYTLDSLDSFKFLVKTQQPLGQSLFYQPRDWELVSLKEN